ncbi:MAG: DNA primase [Magnetococcales bacterium]|nr:DNA primase [Magnetococcales bacterium]
MPRYPDSFLDRLKERIDLANLIGRHVHLQKKGNSWTGLCPFHKEKTPSFNVRSDHGYFKCFGCDARGDAIDFLMQLQGLSFQDAVETLATEAGLELPASTQIQGDQKQQDAAQRARLHQLQELLAAVNRYFQSQLAAPGGEAGRLYLAKRGLQAATIRRFGLGFAPPGWRHLLNHFGGGTAAGENLEKIGLCTISRPTDHEDGKGGNHKVNQYDRFRNRITFPIHDHRRRLVGFGGRLLEPGEPKYINTPETELYQKGRILYGLDLAQEAIQRQKRVVVVEGYMDLITLVEHGFNNTVATLGTALTADHLRLLWRRCHHLTFCFDGDVAGQKAAWRALERVMEGMEADRHVDFVFLPQGKDPDEVVRREGSEAFQGRLRKAKPLLEFLQEHLSQELQIETPEGTAALIHRVRERLLKVGDPLLRGLFADKIGQKFGLTGSQVLGQITASYQRVPREVRHPAVFPRTAMTGRNFEQALVAILLRHPRFLRELEDDLHHLELENPHLNALLHACIHLSDEWHDTGPLPLEQLSSQELQNLAQTVLSAEETTPDNIEKELEGCLDTCLRRHIVRDMRRMEEKNRATGTWTDQELVQLSGYKKELQRLDQKKRLSLTIH